jgi:DNA polymerase-3 subunit gamma/tau
MGSLYNKYSPQSLEEVLGQKVVKEIIRGMSPENLPNAILLSGIYGSGKTLLAKIIAKKFNCTSIEKPCNQCENCKAIDHRIEDIIEVDAATNNTTESIRELVDTCVYGPYKLKYKVYIIDEIHTLAPKAFDALLMVLQSPPQHVKFIFATTNLGKIPLTFLSRCILLPIGKISPNEILQRLYLITEKENKKIEDSILKAISENCGGSMRHSISMLEPVLLMKEPNTLSVLEFLKILSPEKVIHIFEKVLQGEVYMAINSWQSLNKFGYSEKEFLHSLAGIINSIFLEDHYLSQKYQISNNTLVQFWSIINFQLEALYTNEVPFVIEVTLKMLSVVKDTDMEPILKKYFEVIPKRLNLSN